MAEAPLLDSRLDEIVTGEDFACVGTMSPSIAHGCIMKIRLLFLAFFSLLASFATPVLAQEYDAEVEKSGQKSLVSRIARAPLAAAGVVTGVTVGIPVKIAKDTKYYAAKMKPSLDDGLSVQGKSDVGGQAVSGGLTAIWAFPTALINGTIHGVQRGVQVGGKKPFSKESMSLKDPL